MKRAAYVLVILILILTAYFWFDTMMLPVDRSAPENLSIEIEQGMSGREIAVQLEQLGLIRSSEAVYYYMRFTQLHDLKAGFYTFSTADSPYYMLDILAEGKEDTFEITIPEGFTVEEVINRASKLEAPFFDKQRLNNAFMDKAAQIDIEGMPQLNVELIHPAEGFIVPDTYKFPMSYDESRFVEELFNVFRRKRLPLLKEKAEASDYTAYQILTIASLIEEEGKIADENKIIASVIYNRLDIAQPLQLDATVQYVLPERKERLLYADLEFESPYNTYQISALPPSPIANPGDAAVEAALNPADTDYFYYFALEDGSHIFSENYRQHLDRQNDRSRR